MKGCIAVLNAAGGGRISADGSAVAAWVVRTDEVRMIARHVRALPGMAAAEPGLPLRPRA